MARSDAILKRLLRLHPKIVDLSLDRVRRLLDALGDPHLSLPPVVHVAGTNGKGSTISYLRAGLQAAGHTVHAYTSPHLIRFHERIHLGRGDGGASVSEADLCELLLECEEANGGAAITFFEITTAAAFLAFSRRRADVCLLEVGLGGRLDATNVVEKPELTMITPVDMDHQAYLGDAIESIAAEKAGVMKPGTPCILAPQSAAARAVLEDRAHRAHAPLTIAGRDFQACEERGRLVYRDAAVLLDLPLPGLVGRFQVDNAGAAIAGLRALNGFGIDERHVERAMVRAVWPARMQPLDRGALVDLLPCGSELWIDGGHNASAARAVAACLADLEERVSRRTVLVLGMMASRAPEDFLEPFAGLISRVVVSPIPDEPDAMEVEALAGACQALGMDARQASGVEDAVTLAGDGDGPIRVLVAGSLYLAGRALALNSGSARAGPSGASINARR